MCLGKDGKTSPCGPGNQVIVVWQGVQTAGVAGLGSFPQLIGE